MNNIFLKSQLFCLLFTLPINFSYSFTPLLNLQEESETKEFNIKINDLVVTRLNISYPLEIDMSIYIGSDKFHAILDCEKIKSDVISFVKNYPDEAAYWELVNKDLCNYLSINIPSISFIRSKMKMLSNWFEPNEQWSIVEYESKDNFKEHYGFAFLPGELKDLIDPNSYLEVDFTYIKDVTPKDFVEHFLIMRDLTLYFDNHPLDLETDNVLNEQIDNILKKYLSLTSCRIQLYRHVNE